MTGAVIDSPEHPDPRPTWEATPEWVAEVDRRLDILGRHVADLRDAVHRLGLLVVPDAFAPSEQEEQL